MAQLINRDPFARTELWRNRHYLPVKAPKQTCDWCGGLRYTLKSKAPYLYSYFQVADDSSYKTHVLKGLFCSESCRQSFNN